MVFDVRDTKSVGSFERGRGASVHLSSSDKVALRKVGVEVIPVADKVVEDGLEEFMTRYNTTVIWRSSSFLQSG